MAGQNPPGRRVSFFGAGSIVRSVWSAVHSGRKGQPTVAALPITVETSGTFSNQSALTIVSRNGKWCVRSLRLGLNGTTRVYSVPRQSSAERELEASAQVISIQIVKSGS